MNRKLILVMSVVCGLALAIFWVVTPEHAADQSHLGSSRSVIIDTEAGVASADNNAITENPSTEGAQGDQPMYPAEAHRGMPSGFDDDAAAAWAQVDLEALRAQMPNNLYWQLAAPTQDASVLAQRKEITSYWEAQFAKINANLASEVEIRAYFDHRQRRSEDYVEFATVLLNQYGDVLPEQARHFQVFARNLNLVQLQELPKKLTQALENRKRFLAKREAWLKDKTAFEEKLAQEREAALRELGKI